MSVSTAAQDHMRRVFTENFSVTDIAEPLVSFDADSAAAEVREVMNQRGYEVVGVRENGLTAGYVHREELADGRCADFLHAFTDAEVVSDSICFPTVVRLLSVNAT